VNITYNSELSSDDIETLEEINAKPDDQLIWIITRLLDQNIDEPWLPIFDISKDAAGHPFVVLHFNYTDEELQDREIKRFSLHFGNSIIKHGAVRTYTLSEHSFEQLKILMTTPVIPGDPNDFDDFLRANRGDFEDDQSMPATSADEMRAAHDMIDPEGKSGECDG
jgi:hypothetical protein